MRFGVKLLQVQEQGPNNVFGTLSHKHQPVIPREFGWTCNAIFNKYNLLKKKLVRDMRKALALFL
jgi:hypothetical protein